MSIVLESTKFDLQKVKRYYNLTGYVYYLLDSLYYEVLGKGINFTLPNDDNDYYIDKDNIVVWNKNSLSFSEFPSVFIDAIINEYDTQHTILTNFLIFTKQIKDNENV